MAADVLEVGYKTQLKTPSEIGGVRLSETKGAHKSQALVIVVIRADSSRQCWMGGQSEIGCRLMYFEKGEGFRGLTGVETTPMNYTQIGYIPTENPKSSPGPCR